MTYEPPTVPSVALAPISRRFFARLIDGFIVALPIVVALFATSDVGDASKPLDIPLWFVLAALLLGALYEITLVATLGQTVGKRLLGIKIVHLADGDVPGWGSATIRYLLPTAVGALPIVQFLALVVYLRALWDPMRQGFHDRAAGTIVIRV